MIQEDGVSVPDRATAAEPEVSALRDGIANAPKTMADAIPDWGEFLGGLAAACEKADPEAWKHLVEACEQIPAEKATP